MLLLNLGRKKERSKAKDLNKVGSNTKWYYGKTPVIKKLLPATVFFISDTISYGTLILKNEMSRPIT